MGVTKGSNLGERLAGLEKKRGHFMSESAKGAYLLDLVSLVNEQVFRPSRRSGPEQLYGRLYYDRSRREFVRQIRKRTFVSVRPTRVVSGYGLRKLEQILLQMLVDQVSGKNR